MKSWHTLVVEWNFATYKDVKNDAKGPNIYFWTRIYLGIQELWRGEIKGTTERGQMVGGIVEIRKSKINNLDITSL